MRKFFGIFLISIGVFLLLSTVGLILFNHFEAENAEKYAKALLLDAQNKMEAALSETSLGTSGQNASVTIPQKGLTEMSTVSVNGYECIGVLSIPVFELELPVLTDWNYEKLKMAPCHYYGTCYDRNFVIAGHNYTSHFGALPGLQVGDIVIFTDVKGNSFKYEVALVETLPSGATTEMLTSGFDLSLYTCTLDGGSRVTVRCNKAA